MSHAPNETLRAVVSAVAAGLSPLTTVPPQPLSAWAEENFFLSAEASHIQGRWHAYPFQRGWMDAFSNDDIEEVTVRKAKRVGYTKTILAFIAYNAAHRRRKQALWQPTDDDRDSFVKSEVEPMLRDVQALEAVTLPGREATMKLKTFLGSVLHLLGGKAARAYRRITVAVAMLDEADAFDQKIEKSSDPITLARGRLEGAPFPKLIAGSTVRVKGLSHIEYREEHADARMRYQVVCPHCSAEHPLLWGGKDVRHGFKWDGVDPDTARHVCPHCHGSIAQADYLRIWDQGAMWVSECGRYRYDHHQHRWTDAHGATVRAPRHVAFSEAWTAYSPQRSWSDIVREFLEASTKAKAGETGPLEGFVNETLAQYWEETVERADEHALARRAEDYRRFTVPFGGLVLVAGVDVQDDRFEVVVWAIGRGEEMWAVDYSVIHANPADERDWDRLDAYRETLFTHASGQALRIEAMAVDTGGHFTHLVYNYCRQRERDRVFAVRGDPQPSKMVKGKATIQDVNWRGRVVKRGVRLWYVGTDTAKDLIYGRLCVTQPGAGYVHFSKDLPPEFYHQLTAEARVPQRTSRGIEYRWVNSKRARNEVLDCSVYAIFCTHALGLHTYTGAMWSRLESTVQPANADLFAAPRPRAETEAEAASEPAIAPAAPKPRFARRPAHRPHSFASEEWNARL
ncbi:phage terminase large subunit family protein [Variovorax sp. J22P168]|uniref:phage terminase large subunit family protein n=1 Tax=Variovorax jilinensis TaxID=3053513 RepID=UPI002578D382|nr:terminase gpA endonuclease subunit [Variovorax sp. J22P168]MDM0011977.1 phage terminase large subunit family protein [Variovorax sp. J22P168]